METPTVYLQWRPQANLLVLSTHFWTSWGSMTCLFLKAPLCELLTFSYPLGVVCVSPVFSIRNRFWVEVHPSCIFSLDTKQCADEWDGIAILLLLSLPGLSIRVILDLVNQLKNEKILVERHLCKIRPIYSLIFDRTHLKNLDKNILWIFF